MKPLSVLRNLWTDAVILGGLWHDFTRVELVKTVVAFCLGAFCMFVLRAYEHSGPATIQMIPPDKMQVTVEGTDVLVHIEHIQTRPNCPGTYAVRQMVKFWHNREVEGPQEVVNVMEKEIMWDQVGPQNFIGHLHLYGPLHGEDWNLVYRKYENCGWLDDLFPTHPSSGKPIPVTVAVIK